MSASTLRRSAALAATAALTTALSVLAVQPASAAPSPHPAPAAAQGEAQIASADADVLRADRARKAARNLGDQAAGVWYDAARDRMVLNVTDQAAARSVGTTGVATRVVKHGSVDLAAATRTLQAKVSTPGSSWAVDPRANQVVVSLDSSVSNRAAARIERVTAAFGDAVRVERTEGRLSPMLSGGQAIYGAGYRCSLGFNVRSGSTYSFLTAGHCTNLSSSWYSNSSQTSLLGTRTGTSFPGNDYGIVRYSTTAGSGNVYLYNSTYRDITTSGNAYVGQAVTRSGSTTGVHTGTVTGLNATVNYPEGTVSGLIKTNVCAEGGDSGGSLFAGSTALGLTSGGSGNCTIGGTTYFQPVTEVLGAYGVSVY